MTDSIPDPGASIAAALDGMHTRYGTIEGYFTDGLGLGPDVQAALRDELIDK
jgi:protein-tyrosine phosphatase